MFTMRGLVAVAASATVALLVSQGAAFGQLTQDERKCSDKVNNFTRGVVNQEQKKNRKCIKDSAGGAELTCVDTIGTKTAAKAPKVTDLFAAGDKCDPVPAFGVNSGGAPAGQDIVDGAVESAGDIIKAIFSSAVDGIVAGDKCQDKLAQRPGKQYDTYMKQFRKCAKALAAINSITDLEVCTASTAADAKVTKLTTKTADDADKKCTFPSPAGTENGSCSGAADGTAIAACTSAWVTCEACAAINNMTGGNTDCNTLSGVTCDGCGLAAGSYTLTQGTGGSLAVDGLPAFPFPAGGTIVQDVSAASPPTCVHSTVVPSPGGFSAPAFCIPALGFTTTVVQTGCGVGAIDSNGGSDFTVSEVGDTSSPGVCGTGHAGCAPGVDSNVQVDVGVGDGATDSCGSGSANAIVSIPVFTTTWLGISPGGCPDGDGTYSPGDVLVVSFPQTLDFTTDQASADWADLDPDGCCLAGAGPSGVSALPCGGAGGGGFIGSGTCLDTGSGSVTTVAAGTIGSSGAPLFDLTFLTTLPNTLSAPGSPLGATCPFPPAIALGGGTVTRCI